MKAISLWQPWATLIAIGAKQIETRGWQTGYRGLLAIHAAKKWTRDLAGICYQPHFAQALVAAGYGPMAAPICRRPDPSLGLDELLSLGGIVCVCRIVDCAPTERHRPSDRERAFGDFRDGRFGWWLEDVVKLAKPIPFSGRQGFFDVPGHLLEGLL